MKSMANPIMIRDLVGHCGSPPAFPDCSLISYERRKNGTPVKTMITARGSKKNRWPTTSIVSRTHFGRRLFTMSMRICSLERRVQGEHKRNTTLNRTHCNSSHELEEVSKTLRTE